MCILLLLCYILNFYIAFFKTNEIDELSAATF